MLLHHRGSGHVARKVSESSARMQGRDHEAVGASAHFSICHSLLFWQRGNQPALACRAPEKKDLLREHRPSPPTLQFYYADFDQSELSPKSLSALRQSGSRPLLSGQNFWSREFAGIRFFAGAEPHDVRRCGGFATGLPKTHSIRRP